MEMKQIKIQDVQGKALDYLVAKCEGLKTETWHTGAITVLFPDAPRFVAFNPSTNWGHGGPIVERERITLGWSGMGSTPEYKRKPEAYYLSTLFDEEQGWHQTGQTPLMAAMRCYVASKLGDVVEVPASLL